MVVSNNKLTTTKNAGKLLAISIAMRMRQYNAGHIARWSTLPGGAHPGLHSKPMDAAIG
jgi:hypothetical protein